MIRNPHSVSFRTAARANDAFDRFLTAETLPKILESYQNICDELLVQPDVFTSFYPKIKANLRNWRSREIFEKFDARAKQKCYADGEACRNKKVLIIGAGPCGLRTAIEAQLLGAKVVVIEKRNYISRNNVLRLWPFVIEDLRGLSAKSFVRQFCISSIDHVSTKQLQSTLLKIALLLGVEIHTKVSFENLIEPNSEKKIGWRAQLNPVNHAVSEYEFDTVVGADGGRSSFSKDFKQKELRGKRAIAITVNFVNRRSEAETKVPEISGVSYVYNQSFFNKMGTQIGIYLENIIYYKDDTHYFVMTPKKSSLIAKGVIKQDRVGRELLHPNNVNQEALQSFVKEVVEFSTKYQLPNLEFATNHWGRPDVSMFDFSTMYVAESSSKFTVRNNYKLLKLLVGDGLLQPFWPTGSGCARGFLSSLDAAWAMKMWSSGVKPLDVLIERESIFKLLAQTTSENLNKNVKAFTLDPCTRYRNLNKKLVSYQQILNLYDSEDFDKIRLAVNKLSSEKSVEVRSSKSKLANASKFYQRFHSVDVSLPSASVVPQLMKIDSRVWNRCQSIECMSTQKGDNKKDFSKRESISDLVSKFEMFASGSLDQGNFWKPSFDAITCSTPVSELNYEAQSSPSNDIFNSPSPPNPNILNSTIKHHRGFEQQEGTYKKITENYNSKLEITLDKTIQESQPASAAKRRSSISSVKDSLKKRFKRSNLKRFDNMEPGEASEGVGLNDRILEKTEQKRFKRSIDQGPSSEANRKLAFKRLRDKYETKKKRSTDQGPSSEATNVNRKLDFKRLRDKYEFGDFSTENLDSKQRKSVKKSNSSERRFSGVTNFVSNIFRKKDQC